MTTKIITTTNPIVGLHAIPLTFFAQKANEYIADIWFEKDGKRINAKSFAAILMHSCIHGSEIKLVANGIDEAEAIETLSEYIEKNFDYRIIDKWWSRK